MVGHLDEGESTGPAGLPVEDNIEGSHFAVLLKESLQIRALSLVAKVSDVQLDRHAHTSFSPAHPAGAFEIPKDTPGNSGCASIAIDLRRRGFYLPVVDTTILDEAAWYLRDRRIAVLTGAGISTESGIPDYRGPLGALRKRTPIRYYEFLSDTNSRRQYWARSAVGWPRADAAGPNPAHFALARLEEAGLISALITQNVDGLHQQAGSKLVIELHGSLQTVVCLGCGRRESRRSVQRRIEELNPGWDNRRVELAPDGDAELPVSLTERFQIPSCSECGGILKPDVVFFGENVPKATVDRAFDAVEAADALLVAGTSLTVYSGLRFLDRAAKKGIPAVVVNMGEVRGAHLAAVHVEARLGEALPALVDRVIGNKA